MPADSNYPAPFDTSTFIFPAEWHAFSDLLGGAHTGLLLQRDGVILHLNAQLEAQLGFEEKELVGKPVESLFPNDNAIEKAHPAGNAQLQLLTKAGQVLG